MARPRSASTRSCGADDRLISWTVERNSDGGRGMVSVEQSREVLLGMKEAGIDFVASVPDTNLAELLSLLDEDRDVAHVPVGREEEGIGVCVGAYLGGKRPAMLMQNAGLLNSCNALTTTGMQF